ncbi:hypothetical protein KDX30_15630 [Pseudomonas sp. CDFA 553]|uniref:hypothetical protein n=1 Tax=Pseudomonas quasicaspiana TaxID=2829821 RepID=UPI001E3F295C|nr:hypothetical protein [Pseudomonas quasicaspiana]MCD5989328.1 hypothetical protein [Pseudomonas quasicaspiana]
MPYENDAEFVQLHYKNEQYPRENSLSTGHGFYCFFELYSNSSKLEEKRWLPALDFVPQHAGCEGLSVLISKKVNNLLICGGECHGYGGDGFISVVDSNTESLLWLVVFSETNPFSEIEFINQNIEAISTCETKVILPLFRPDRAIIEWS